MIQPIKKLYRSEDDRIIAGVAGGLGEFFNVDPLFVRLIFVLLALVHGLGILFYVILVFIIPKKGEENLDAQKAGRKLKEFAGDVEEKAKEVAGKIEKEGKGFFGDRKKLIGLVILVVGLLVLLDKIVPVRWFRWDIFWPIALIVAGSYLLVRADKKEKLSSSE